jgi:cell division septation protein DedD
MASHIDEPRKPRGVGLLSALVLAVGVAVPVGAQESLAAVDSLALAGRADEARTELDSWWLSERATSNRRDRQHGLWLRAILTVDPRMAGLDFQRLVLEYPGGSYSDEAMLRLGLISSGAGDLPRAADYFRTLVSDYPRSPRRRQAEEWLSDHSVEVEEAEAAAQAAEAAAREAEAVAVGGAATAAATAAAAAAAAAAPAPSAGDVREPEVDSPAGAETASLFYAVQVGAFESEDRARDLLAAVNASGFRARIVRVPESPLVRVRVGAFPDRAGAVELMDRVRRRGHEATIAADVPDEEPLP